MTTGPGTDPPPPDTARAPAPAPVPVPVPVPAGASPEAARAGEATAGETLAVASTGGALLHVEIDGPARPAPTVVLAHGWTCDTTFWEEVATRLVATGHRVVRYDQRGHGRSRHTPGNVGTEELADDLCAVLEAATAPGDHVVVGGHSMGAITVVSAAGRASFRGRVASAMLCSTGMDRLSAEARVLPFRSVALRERVQRFVVTSSLPLGPVTPASERALAHATLGPGASQGLRRRVARMTHACGRAGRAEWGRVLDRLDLGDRLADLTVPTAVVHGTRDRLTPVVHAHRMAAALPNCQGGPVLLDGLGHMTPLEAPERVAEVLARLVSEHPSVREDDPPRRGGDGAPADPERDTAPDTGADTAPDTGAAPPPRAADDGDRAPGGRAPADRAPGGRGDSAGRRTDAPAKDER